ncbi:MAG: TIGR00730 family Rossman fold protein, partial [Deltaproteobacteria bacterium]
MRAVCVFTGSSSGGDPRYARTAAHLGRALAGRGIGLVYGGGRVGLMGTLADACLEADGHVVGVIPRFLMEWEVGHRGVSELVEVDSMHTRKAEMAARSDGFIALPGGIGTMEELFEVWTWAQLGSHDKPVGMLDVAGYYAPLLTFVDHMVDQGFLRPHHRELLIVDDDVDRLLDRMASRRPVALPG